MNIIEALEVMDRGERVRHDSWHVGMVAVKIDGTYAIVSHGKEAGVFAWTHVNTVRDGWSIVREQFDFAEAVRRMNKGKSVRRASWEKHDWLSHTITVGAIAPEDATATDWEEV
jgi:hypothetical protein